MASWQARRKLATPVCSPAAGAWAFWALAEGADHLLRSLLPALLLALPRCVACVLPL